MKNCLLAFSLGLVFPLFPLMSQAVETSQVNYESCREVNYDSCKYLHQGFKAYQARNYQQAIEIWSKAKGIIRRNTISSEAATIDNYLALAYLKSDRLNTAKNIVSSGLQIHPTPQLNNTRGQIALKERDYNVAAQHFDLAIEMYRTQQDSEGEMGAQLNKAIAYHKLGQFRQSKYLLEKLNSNLEKFPQLSVKIKKNLGITYGVTGDYHLAEVNLKQALKEASGEEKKAIAIDLGNILVEEEPTKSLEYYDLATLGESELSAVALLKAIDPLISLQQSQKAEANLKQAKSIIKSYQDNSLELLYARQQIALGKWDLSQQRKLEKIARSGIAGERITALGYLARYEDLNNNTQKVIDLTNKAIDLALQEDLPHLAYQWQHLNGRKLGELGLKDEAINRYQQAVANIKKVRGDLVGYNPDIQYSFRQDIEPVYRELVALLVDNPSQEDLVAARDTIENLQLAELENYFRSACLTSTPQAIDNLDAKTATVYPIVLPDKLVTIINVPNQGLKINQVDISADSVSDTVNQFILNNSPTRSTKLRQQAGGQIYDWFISSHLDSLQQQGINSLIFVLDSELRNLPLAAVNNSAGKYLIQDYNVAIAPGLQLLSSRPLHQGKVEAIVGGLSKANQGFAELPGVESEIEQIKSSVAAKTVVNEEFTNEAIKERLAGVEEAPILHFATHGKFSSDPKETFILSWDDKINVEEIENILKVREETPKIQPIELLILSACETAVGDDRAALGLAGMAIKSGARSTLATLWQINDESTSQMIGSIYSNLNNQSNLSKAEILRQAQLKAIDSKFSHPYYWAGFTLVGNPQ